MSLSDIVTTEDLRDHLDAEEITQAINRLTAVVEELSLRIDGLEKR